MGKSLEGQRPFPRLYIVYRLFGPVDSSFRALSGRLNFTVRRHMSNKDSLSLQRTNEKEPGGPFLRGRRTVSTRAIPGGEKVVARRDRSTGSS